MSKRFGFFALSVLLFAGTATGDSSDIESTLMISHQVEELLDTYSETHEQPYEYWQLTSEEWARYEDIVKNSPWSVWNNNATPLAILSHYATSMAEKRRYAHIEAELDQWRQHVTVQFQTLYDQERAIVSAEYVHNFGQRQPVISNVLPSDYLKLFVDGRDCDPRCRSVVGAALDTHAHLDIFVTNVQDKDAIFAWAEKASIPVERVKVKQVTLNFGDGVLQGTDSLESTALPILYRRHNGDMQKIVI